MVLMLQDGFTEKKNHIFVLMSLLLCRKKNVSYLPAWSSVSMPSLWFIMNWRRLLLLNMFNGSVCLLFFFSWWPQKNFLWRLIWAPPVFTWSFLKVTLPSPPHVKKSVLCSLHGSIAFHLASGLKSHSFFHAEAVTRTYPVSHETFPPRQEDLTVYLGTEGWIAIERGV